MYPDTLLRVALDQVVRLGTGAPVPLLERQGRDANGSGIAICAFRTFKALTRKPRLVRCLEHPELARAARAVEVRRGRRKRGDGALDSHRVIWAVALLTDLSGRGALVEPSSTGDAHAVL